MTPERQADHVSRRYPGDSNQNAGLIEVASMASRRPRTTVPRLRAARGLFPAHDHLGRTNHSIETWHEDHCREPSARPRTRRSASISRPSPCERKSKGSPRLHTTPQRRRLGRTRTAAQERGQKKKLELPLPPGSRIQITCSTNADSDASNPRPRDARRRRLDGRYQIHFLGRSH